MTPLVRRGMLARGAVLSMSPTNIKREVMASQYSPNSVIRDYAPTAIITILNTNESLYDTHSDELFVGMEFVNFRFHDLVIQLLLGFG